MAQIPEELLRTSITQKPAAALSAAGKMLLLSSLLGFLLGSAILSVKEFQGVVIEDQFAGLLPGFVGLAVMYFLFGFGLRYLEVRASNAAVDRITEQKLMDVHRHEGSEQILVSRLFGAFDFIYEVALPTIFGLAAITFLWSNIVSVIEFVLAGFVLP